MLGLLEGFWGQQYGFQLGGYVLGIQLGEVQWLFMFEIEQFVIFFGWLVGISFFQVWCIGEVVVQVDLGMFVGVGEVRIGWVEQRQCWYVQCCCQVIEVGIYCYVGVCVGKYFGYVGQG